MIWRDHVLNFGSKSATRVTKFRKKNWRGTSRDSFFFRNFVTLGANFESQNLKHDLARLCFRLYTELKFVANAATGGRVKFLPAVSFFLK